MTRFSSEALDRLAEALRGLAAERCSLSAAAVTVLSGDDISETERALAGDYRRDADVLANAAEALTDFSKTLKGAKP